MPDPALCSHRTVVRIPTPEYLPSLSNSHGHGVMRPYPMLTAHMNPTPIIHRCVDCDLRGELIITRKDTR